LQIYGKSLSLCAALTAEIALGILTIYPQIPVQISPEKVLGLVPGALRGRTCQGTASGDHLQAWLAAWHENRYRKPQPVPVMVRYRVMFFSSSAGHKLPAQLGSACAGAISGTPGAGNPRSLSWERFESPALRHGMLDRTAAPGSVGSVFGILFEFVSRLPMAPEIVPS